MDIYKVNINKRATDKQIVQTGKYAILISLISGALIGMVLLYLKLQDTGAAFTHTLNQLRYFINCGIVVLICAATFLVAPKQYAALIAFGLTIFFSLYSLPYFLA